MNIAIDYTAALKQGGGIGRYTRGLITTLARLDRDDHHYTLLATADTPRDGLAFFQAYPNFSYKIYPLAERWLIGRLLGRPGGFGITYKAWDPVDGSAVAQG